VVVEATKTLWRLICLLVLIWAVGLCAASVAAGRPRIAGLQVALRAGGFYAGPIDAVYGPATARGLRRFQRRARLAVDGRVGPATRRALGQLGRPALGSRILRPGASGWDVSVTQFLLAKAGALLPIDGHFGTRTEVALRKFQRTHQLQVDGIAGRRTFSALLAARTTPLASARSPTEPARVVTLIDYWARHYRVDPTLMRALAWMESGYQPHLTSSVGAVGVMQILPSTREYVETVLLRRRVPQTVSGNIRVGAALMSELLKEFGGRTQSALAAWYQGPTSLRRHGQFRATKLFVADVLALHRRFS
jgi:Transglycosylase SLT domain/Putative peptidoglycan binding domain